MKELVHSDLFSDFLEMADYLLNDGYKDAAAVIGGGVLETHLRQLCVKHNIALDTMIGGRMQPKMADRLNNDLVGNNVYSKLVYQILAFIAYYNRTMAKPIKWTFIGTRLTVELSMPQCTSRLPLFIVSCM